MKIKADVIKYGNNVDTDVIIPARYLNTSNAEELAAHCMGERYRVRCRKEFR